LKIKNDTEYWRYSLNLRGFLLYLFEESQAERKDSRRIRAVILNPAIVEEAPFLMYCQDFENAGFNVIDILRKIGIEFRNQLHYDIDYLLRRATERYYVELTNYFYSLKSPLFFNKYIKNVSLQTDKKLKEYQLKMLKIQREWLTKQIENIDKLTDVYST